MGGINLLSSARGIFLLPLLTRLLGATQYGVYTQFLVLLGLLVPIASLGLDNAILRFLAGEKDRERLKEGFFSSLLSVWGGALLFASISWGCKDLIALFFFDADAGSNPEGIERILLWLFPLLMTHVGSITVTAFLRTIEWFSWYATLTIMDSFCYLLIAILWLLQGGGILGLLGALVVGRSLVILVGLVVIIGKFGVKIPNFNRMPGFLKFSFPLIPGFFLLHLIHYSDRFFILRNGSIEDVARYSAAYTFGGIITLIFAPFFQLVTPRMSALWNEGKRGEVNELVGKAVKFALIPTVPVIFLVGMNARKIVGLYGTEEFSLGWETLSMILVAYSFLMLRAFGKLEITFRERTQLILGVEAGSVLLNLALNYYWVPRLGLQGAALATLLTFAIQFAIYSVLSRQTLSFPLSVSFLLKITGASGVWALLIKFSQFGSPIWNLFVIIGGGVIYLVLIFLMKVVSRSEILAVRHSFFAAKAKV